MRIRKFTTIIKNIKYEGIKENKIYTEGYKRGKSDGTWETMLLIVVAGGLFVSGGIILNK